MKYFILFFAFTIAITNPIISQHKDCEDPLVLCGTSTYKVDVTNGIGMIDSIDADACFSMEYNSFWVEINIKSEGNVTFEIEPDNESMDVDFIVFQTENSDCNSKEIVRCMASGPSGQTATCLGNTGLAIGETDIEESPGCSGDDNNFLAPLEVKEGEQYLVLINEFTSSGAGYQISFDGTAELDCGLSNIESPSSDHNHFKILSTLVLDQLSIEIDPSVSEGSLIIFSMDGQLVFSKDVRSHELVSVDGLKRTGPHVVVLETAAYVESQKVIIIK